VNLRLLMVIAALLCAWTSSLRAEVATIELLGEQASIMGGAVTASSRGGSSIWYNPSRLSFGSGQTVTFAVSGVGVVYRYYNLPKLVVTPEQSYPAQTSELVTLPRATTLVIRARDKLYWGIGLFTPARQQAVLQAGSASSDSGETSYNSVSLEQRRNSYHMVGAVSWNVSERFRVGASLAYVTYVYFRSVQTNSARYDASSGQAMAVLTNTSRQDNIGYGVRGTLGTSFRLAEHVELGASLASPTWLFFSNVSAEESRSQALAGPENPSFSGSLTNQRGLARDRPEPATARAGLSYVNEFMLLELDAEGSLGASSSNFNVTKQAVGNLRAGALFTLKPKLRIGAGIFTDLEQRDKPLKKLGDSRTRGVGGTCGINFVSRLPGGVAKAENAEGTYAVTLAARYTYLTGEVLSLAVTDPGRADGLALTPTSGVVHEMAVQLSLNGAW
jgi:hypothetical protein